MSKVAIWDGPVRLFHAALAVLAVVSLATGTAGGEWMAWHLRSGYAILVLLLFRIAWGFVGSTTARFSSFLAGPQRVAAYAKGLLAQPHVRTSGHNPMGGWMVVLMLALLLLQVATGLVADDEVATQGPLSVFASAWLVRRANQVHELNQWAIMCAIVIHLAAVAFHHWVLRSNLTGPMFHGGSQPQGSVSRRASPGLAAVLFVVASALVFALVVILPRTA